MGAKMGLRVERRSGALETADAEADPAASAAAALIGAAFIQAMPAVPQKAAAAAARHVFRDGPNAVITAPCLRNGNWDRYSFGLARRARLKRPRRPRRKFLQFMGLL